MEKVGSEIALRQVPARPYFAAGYLLGNVVENKKFRPTNQEPKIIQEDCIQGSRSWLTNRCSGSRSRGSSHKQSLDQDHRGRRSTSIRPTHKSLEQVPRTRSPRKKKLLGEGPKI